MFLQRFLLELPFNLRAFSKSAGKTLRLAIEYYRMIRPENEPLIATSNHRGAHSLPGLAFYHAPLLPAFSEE